MDGFLNFYKPQGWTSHDCVAKVRRLLKLKRVGHGGTLDPAATGVLPIALGRATRLLQYLPPDKAYQGRIQLGLTTTTDDLEGDRLSQTSTAQITHAQVLEALQQFRGVITQIPPRYSAIQVQGQRLYDLARQGQDFDVPARTVEIYHLELLDWQSGEAATVEVAIACSAGTYIRAIARDLGAQLGVGGALAQLSRTQSCGLRLQESLTLEALAAQCHQDQFQPLPPQSLLGHLPAIALTPSQASAWTKGQRLPLTPPQNLPAFNAPLVVTTLSGDFLGIGFGEVTDQGSLLRPKLVWLDQ